jgi:TolA-binding protein
MRRKLRLTESELYKVIKRIVEQTEDEYYRISPEDYLDMMKYTSYNGNVFRKMKQYGGKPLYITGDLDLSGKDVKDIGPIAYVDGSLDIRNTKVADLGGLQVKKYISDSGSPRERIRERQELNAKLGEQESLRDSDEWALEQGDETGEKAHALFDNLVNNGEIEPLSEDDKEKLVILRRKLEDLEREYEETEDDDRVTELTDAIDETQSEIEELEENDVDVYMMYPRPRYTHYGLQQFEVLIPGFKDREYTVGTDEEMDEAALEYAKSYVDDSGANGFSDSFIEDYLDVDQIVSMAEDDYDYQVRDYPDSYFSDDDYELSSEQEERIEQLESQIEDLEQQKLELDSDDDNYYEYEEDLDNQIEALQEELDSIEVDTEPSEDMIENKVAELVRDVRRDPLDYLKNLGYDIKDYIDEDALAQGLVDSDGWGIMNSYDGNYDSEDVNGVTYYIMRTN